jgi:hypothetical protein
MRYWVANAEACYRKKAWLQLTVSMEKLTEEERRMTMDSQIKGSEGSHRKAREDIDSNDRES